MNVTVSMITLNEERAVGREGHERDHCLVAFKGRPGVALTELPEVAPLEAARVVLPRAWAVVESLFTTLNSRQVPPGRSLWVEAVRP